MSATNLFQTIQETSAALKTVPEEKKQPLVTSLVQLIQRVSKDLGRFADIPLHFNNKTYPALTGQITAAEKRTEKAADDIMTAAEKIMSALAHVDGAGKTDIQTGLNAIFEASSFQDLVAQHLQEIRTLTEDINTDMKDLATNFSTGSSDEGTMTRPPRDKRPDAHLLNGPTTDF